MPALVAGIHVLRRSGQKDVDSRDEPGYDDESRAADCGRQMTLKKKTRLPRTKSERIGSDLRRVDAYVLGPKDYDEIPEPTEEWFRRATVHIGGVPIPRGPGMRVRIDAATRKAGMLLKVRRKKAR
jgi:hypothetical protein